MDTDKPLDAYGLVRGATGKTDSREYPRRPAPKTTRLYTESEAHKLVETALRMCGYDNEGKFDGITFEDVRQEAGLL